MHGLISICFSLLLMLPILCDNKEPSAVCQQKFRGALTLKYLYGLNAFDIVVYGTRKSSQLDKPGLSQINLAFLQINLVYLKKLHFSGEELGLSEMIQVFLRKTRFFTDKFGFSPDKLGFLEINLLFLLISLLFSPESARASQKPGCSDWKRGSSEKQGFSWIILVFLQEARGHQKTKFF